MAQPNFQNLSAAFATASNEIALLPNLPVVNLAEQIQQIHQMLQEMQQGLQNLQQGQQNLQQGQQQIRQDILRSDRNNFARLINSSVTRADTPLEPLYDLGGQLIQNFPQTSEEIKTLNGAMIDTLLNSLTLPTNGARLQLATAQVVSGTVDVEKIDKKKGHCSRVHRRYFMSLGITMDT
ncbi:uncharacterized protein LAJ45_02462 [Morchella importuna]|uniref:uncharacterized protein n=1 Tax=Morchella importuna TaxID=1174673 RepID=UPI001E8D285A|nr:uncharacterized protein LAJ45_02462 [Morchella importuna]KAH8153649.1 hypothetical protein LAJ45_02462 [Morchella importuna]